MPTFDKYSSESFIRLLLQGEPGAGKTSMALQFPKVWVLDCDQNLGGPTRFLKSRGLTLPVGYDIIDRDDSGKVVPDNMRWDRLISCVANLQKLVNDGTVQTIVLDSMSKINDYNKADVLRKNPTKTGGFEQTSWGFFYANWVKLVGALTASKVHLVLTAHDRVDKDEFDGSTKIMLNTQGQFQAQAGSMFSDVWHAEIQSSGVPVVHKRVCRTIQSYKYAGLKNSFQLPDLFEFDWKTIEAKLKA